MPKFVKHSIGKLRRATKTKPRSPEMTGKLAIQRSTLETIARQLNESGDDEIACNLAAWFNRDREGAYLTIQISPIYERAPPKMMSEDEFFNALREEEQRHEADED